MASFMSTDINAVLGLFSIRYSFPFCIIEDEAYVSSVAGKDELGLLVYPICSKSVRNTANGV